MLQLFLEFQEYQVIYRTMKRLTASFLTCFATLYLMMYIYAIFGEALFGGMVTISSVSAQDPDIPALYYLMNFNDFPSSFVTLFHILVINNWYITADMISNEIKESSGNIIYVAMPKIFFLSF